MGGKALKNINCIRTNKLLYEEIKSIVLSKLLKICNFIPILEIPEKDSFGDLDLLYDSDINIKNIVNDLFSPKEISSNGNVLSFSYKINEIDYFQIDLIKVDNIEMAKFYFGYGEVGLILGRILKKNNLTFGHEGIWVNYENEKIILYENPIEICKFIGLNYTEWLSGFKNKKELFNWIIECKYFNIDYFDIEKFNSDYKKYYEKRPNFKEFINYIFSIKEKLILIEKPSMNYKVVDFIKICCKSNEKEKIDNKLSIIKLYQEKFNGSQFLPYTIPQNINQSKNEFKEYISKSNNFNEWLQNNSIEFINNKIKDFMNQISNH